MYYFTSSLPESITLDTAFDGSKAYQTLIKNTDKNYVINELVLTKNGIQEDGHITKIDSQNYRLDIESWDNGDRFNLTGSLRAVNKPYRLSINAINCTSSVSSGDYDGALEFDVTVNEGYEKFRAYVYVDGAKNTKAISETETGYHISITENMYNRNSYIEVKITVKKGITYTVVSNVEGLVFNPPLPSVLTKEYRGFINPPENYHFINFDITYNNQPYTRYNNSGKGYQVIFTPKTDGDVYRIVTRIEQDITEDNEDKYPFIRIYNPTNKDLDELSKQRYQSLATVSSDFNFTDIANQIIDLRKIYINLPKNEPYQDMLLGKYNTGIKVNQVLGNNIEVDCGTITINEQFHNIADYILTTIDFYLPFIGIKNIDSDLIMNHEVGLKYNVSIISGDFIATLYLKDINKVIDLYSGNLSFEIPYTTDYQNKYHGELTDNDKSMIDLTPYCTIKYHPISESPYTKYCREYLRLEDLEGFTIIDNLELHLDENYNMLYDEEQELYSLMKEGIML